MKPSIQILLEKPIFKVIACLIIVGLTLISYWDILSYGLTGCDTLTLIETGEISSLQDLRDTFTTSLMEGSQFSSNFKYYRPISSLSYAFDYAIWGIQPLGYLLHNLVLHALNGLLVWTLTSRITKRYDIALLAAILFVCNPVLIESVPGIPRRQDIIPITFTLIALIANADNFAKPPRPRAVLIGCLAFGLALMSKESAALITIHIFTFNLILKTNSTRRFTDALKGTLPYLATAFPILLWRSYVIGGLGGGWREFAGNQRLSIILEYAYTLLTPLAFIFPGFGLPLTILVVTLIGLITWRTAMFSWFINTQEGRYSLFAFTMMINALSLYIITAVYGPWMAYGSAIPYSILLGTFIICGFQGLQQADKTKQVKFGIGTLAFCFGLGLILLQYRFSPLLVTYNGWDKSADYNYDILSQIAEHIDELPDPGLITVRNASFRHFTGKNPTLVRSATYLKAYSIKSYLHFIKPGNHIVVVMRDPHSYKTVPDYIELSFEQLGPNHTDIRINYPLYEPEPGNRKKIKRTKRTPERETVQREQLRRELTK